MREDQTIHVLMGVMPLHFSVTTNHYHDVVEHRHPFVAFLSTTMVPEKLDEFKNEFARNYGNPVEVSPQESDSHILLLLKYPQAISTEELSVRKFVEDAKRLAKTKHRESNIVPPDRC